MAAAFLSLPHRNGSPCSLDRLRWRGKIVPRGKILPNFRKYRTGPRRTSNPTFLTMKSPLFLPIAVFAVAFLAASPRASAQAHLETSWTSNDGVTIWAQLVGWDGSHFLLKRGGRDYRVPPGRLTEGSREKARKMLDLDPKKLPQASARPEAVPTSSRPVETPPSRPDRQREPSVSRTSETQPGFSPAVRNDTAPPPSQGVVFSPRPAEGGRIRLEGKRAIAPAGVPSVVRTAIEAGNRLQNKPYKWGGGRVPLEDSGYDCSGSVSYVLIKAGLLRSPGTSRTFMKYGEPGPGRWITIYARNGHVFMTICGLRLDTGGSRGRGESGPRWRPAARGGAGFVMRHPPGF